MLHPKHDYDPDNPFPALEPRKNTVERYLSVEEMWMPQQGYLQLANAQAWRDRAVAVIFNVARRENLDALIPYLAMNYYDRYVSGGNRVRKFMKSKRNGREFLCLCCLTLAWKMRDNRFSAFEFLRRHPELAVVTPKNVLDTELHILKGIEWKLRPLTALCFVQFFEPELNSAYGFRRRTLDLIIMNAQNDIENTEFRPSVMAAAALLTASWFLYPVQYEYFFNKIASKIVIDEADLSLCIKVLIQQCKELNTLIESAVAENEYLPKLMVRAGEDEQRIAAFTKGAGTMSEQAARESSGIVIQNPETETIDTEEDEDVLEEAYSGMLQRSLGRRLTLIPEEPRTEELTAEETDRRRKGKAVADEEETRGILALNEDYPKELTPNPEEAKLEELTREEAERLRKGKGKVNESKTGGIPEAGEYYPAGFMLRWMHGERNAAEFSIFTTGPEGPMSRFRRRFRRFCCAVADPGRGH